MNRTLSLALVALLAACGSTKVVWPDDDIEDGLFQIDNGEDNGIFDPEDLHVKDKGEEEDTPIYTGNALLEYFEPYGDTNIKCQGFADPPANSQKIASCDFEMSYKQVRAFKVVFFVEGKAFSGQEIEWQLQGDKDPNSNESLLTVDALSSGTDAEGVATLKVTTDDIAGQFTITAKVASGLYPVKPLVFKVKILPKAVEPLTVKLKYDGSATIELFNVYLYDQSKGDYACANLIPDELPTPADKGGNTATVATPVKFMTFSQLSVENPKLYYTAVAVGTKQNTNAALAYACNDVDAVVEIGKSNILTLVLKDIPPKYAGTYEVINHFDMISALPDDVEVFVNIIIDFFNSPTAGLLELACVLGENSLDWMCDNIFANPSDPNINQLTAIGSIIVQVVNSILYGLLADNVGQDILFTGKDVGNILRDLEVYSTIVLAQEPDNTGFLGKEYTEETWETVSFQWTLGENCNPADPDCGLKSYSFNAIGQDVIIGHFDMQIDGYVLGKFDKMRVYEHPLNFKYGAFINFVIEKMVLPEIAGDGSDGLPVVDSYDKFIKSLLGGKECLIYDNCCSLFVQSIVDQTSPAIQGTLTAGCNALITLGVTYFQTWLVSLDASSGDGLNLYTAEDNPCTLYDKNNDHIIDGMGRKEPVTDRCIWKTRLMLLGMPVIFDAEFWGNRVQ